MENLGTGLTILIMGLAITFTALAIFMGVISLLRFLFPAAEAAPGHNDGEEWQPVSTLDRDTTDEEIAAAITVALAQIYSHALCCSELGLALEAGIGPWWVAGRLDDQHTQRELQIKGRN